MEESIDPAAAPSGESEAEAQVSAAKAPAKYSTLSKMGLFFMQMTRRLNRAAGKVETNLHEPESRTQ